jgi:chemotaxis protein MotB
MGCANKWFFYLWTKSTNMVKYVLITVLSAASLTSCVVSKKKYNTLQTELDAANKSRDESLAKLNDAENRKAQVERDLTLANSSIITKQDQIDDLKEQLADCRAVRDKQLSQVGDLTVLTQAANDNIKETLSQLERKDKYIQLLQAAKTKADSLNLALAVNLKSVLDEGLDDQDVEVKVDKTVVFVNLSDKMLFKSGSAELTPKAAEILAKIAKIIEAHPELEVMVEGYTDNDPIKNSCMKDNWDLSVKRSTAVVRLLQKEYNVNPNKLIAAGRGEYNSLVPNDSAENKAINRRTRIIIMPKLDQFYDLLNPNNVPK